MTKTRSLMLALAATLPLAACNNGGNSGNGNSNGNGSIPLSLLVSTMFTATSETATPVEINALPIDTSNDDPTLYNALII